MLALLLVLLALFLVLHTFLQVLLESVSVSLSQLPALLSSVPFSLPPMLALLAQACPRIVLLAPEVLPSDVQCTVFCSRSRSQILEQEIEKAT